MNHLGRQLKIYEVNPVSRAETFVSVRFLEEKSTATERTHLNVSGNCKQSDAQTCVNLLVRSVKFFEEEFTADEQIGKNMVF
ncbi:Uncharacterised protein [Veillonella criceti]|uniref:Uncharacterized protein n=1 Tax=Veillonella criceti TaxID=103891 RepID=A0A380NHW4_9FIRM|nr:Uncharacterised protein [Veillonella criceti]